MEHGVYPRYYTILKRSDLILKTGMPQPLSGYKKVERSERSV
jgi:hypothetical protein